MTTNPDDIARIAGELSEAQRNAILSAEWIGSDLQTMCVVEFTTPLGRADCGVPHPEARPAHHAWPRRQRPHERPAMTQDIESVIERLEAVDARIEGCAGLKIDPMLVSIEDMRFLMSHIRALEAQINKGETA